MNPILRPWADEPDAMSTSEPVPPTSLPQGNPILDRIRLALVVLVHVIVCLWLIADRRLPLGHDTFQYFSMQYCLLNNRITAGEVPQWMPYMSQGTVSNWWYC